MWLHDVDAVEVQRIAEECGLRPRRNGSFSPCPACGSDQRGSTDKRGPIGFRRDNRGWRCHSCGTGGFGVDLVSLSVVGKRYAESSTDDRTIVRNWYENHGLLSAGTKPVSSQKVQKKPNDDLPPQSEVKQLWSNCYKLNEVAPDDDVFAFLSKRNLDLAALSMTGCVRVSPAPTGTSWPAWWPRGRATKWKLIVPAFNAKGDFCSLHARTIYPTDGAPKTLWPKGYRASGLFFPNRSAVAIMRGAKTDVDGLLIVEGITDFMKAASRVVVEGLNIAVIGGTSGSFSSLGKIKVPETIKIFAATDPDDAGDKYFNTIKMQFGNRPVYRLPLLDADGDDDDGS